VLRRDVARVGEVAIEMGLVANRTLLDTQVLPLSLGIPGLRGCRGGCSNAVADERVRYQ
jgi:hypothetical protein